VTVLAADRKIIANTLDNEEVRVAIVEKGRLYDIFIERMWERQRTGEIYKARVDSVLPGMNSAFLNLGDGRNAFLYLDDARGRKLKPNEEVIVQVMKTARKGKGARVTTRLSLPGRYLVLVPGGRESGVSKRIEDDDERHRLRRLAREIRPDGCGVIIRTAAEGVDGEELAKDVGELLEIWKEVEHNAAIQSAPCLLYRDLGLLGRVLRDELTEEVSEIVVDSDEELERIRPWVERFCHGTPPEMSLYRGHAPIFDFYGIEKELESLLDRKHWLESGAYLIIDQTEALTVIDVNTGKFVGRTNLRDTVLKTNLEAADEIARQLRLRAIGGIVVIDFIDMEQEEDRQRLLDRLNEAFHGDRYKARVFGVTQLGLVEITRKRARLDLRTSLTRGCPFCSGTGWVLKEETLAVSVKRFLRKVSLSSRSEAILLELYPDVARHIADTYLPSWEEELGRRLFLREVPDFAWSKYRLDSQGPLSQIERRVAQLMDKEAAVVHCTAEPEGL
jgi:ribonuclease G